MDNPPDINSQVLSQLKWSSVYIKVSEFLQKYSLPQIVKITGGFYGVDSESTIGANQVLCLHSLKSIEKIKGKDRRGKEISLFLECKSKVEVRPSNMKDVYESVSELFAAFPRYVRISQGYYSLAKDEEILNVGDKLCLKSIDKSKKGKRLICVNQNGRTIELPKDCVAGFQPLKDGKEYYLAEVMTRFPMPLHVQFVDPHSMGAQTRSDENAFCQPLRTICLHNTYTEKVIVATSVQSNGTTTVVKFPPDIELYFLVCEDMLKNSADYVELCKNLNQDFDSRNFNTNVYEYIDDQVLTEIFLDAPSKLQPRKRRSTKGHKEAPQSEVTQPARNVGLNEGYEEIENYAEMEKDSTQLYTQLDPTYISKNTHVYEKPLKQVGQLGRANPDLKSQNPSGIPPGIPPGNLGITPPASQSPLKRPTKSPVTPEKREPANLDSSSHHSGKTNPPPVPVKPSSIHSQPKRAGQANADVTQLPVTSPAVPHKPHLPKGAIQLPIVPHRKPATPDRIPPVSDISTSEEQGSMPESPVQQSNGPTPHQDKPESRPQQSNGPTPHQDKSESRPQQSNGPTPSQDRPESQPQRPSGPTPHQDKPESRPQQSNGPTPHQDKSESRPQQSNGPTPHQDKPESRPQQSNGPTPHQDKPESRPQQSNGPTPHQDKPESRPQQSNGPTPHQDKPESRPQQSNGPTPHQDKSESRPQQSNGPTPSQDRPESQPQRPSGPTPSQAMPALSNSPSDSPLLPTSKPLTPREQKEETYAAFTKYPLDLTTLSVSDVSRLLKYLGMGIYVELFAAELVDGEMLASMDKRLLQSLNVSAFHITKLLKFIGGWRPNLESNC